MVAIDDDDHYVFVASPAKRYLRVEKYPHQPGVQRLIVRVEPRHTTRLA